MKNLIIIVLSLFTLQVKAQSGAIQIAKDTSNLQSMLFEAMINDASNCIYTSKITEITSASYREESYNSGNSSNTNSGGGTTNVAEKVTYIWVNVSYMSYPSKMYLIDYAIVNAPEGTSESAITNAVDKPRIRIGFVSQSERVYKCESSNCGSEISSEARKYGVSAVNCGTFYIN